MNESQQQIIPKEVEEALDGPAGLWCGAHGQSLRLFVSQEQHTTKWARLLMAETKYNNKVANRDFYMEQGLVADADCIGELPKCVSTMICARHWELLIKKPEPAVMEVVKEFYANFLSHEWPTEVVNADFR
uniref:Uncharacterized protein n=1 Tax=Cannabis sativa TaxID=3483 RepID=A0A803QN52_CANSA